MRSAAAGRVDIRTHVLDVAEALFLREGVRATGVDTVSAQARVAKTTLYRHYPSKDDLVVAYLGRRDRIHFDWLQVALDLHPGDAGAQLAAVIDLVAGVVMAPGFAGCPFLNAAAEFADPAHPARLAVAAHKTRVVNKFAELASGADARQPRILAAELALLTDGAYEAGRVLGPDGPARTYRDAAQSLLARRRGPNSAEREATDPNEVE